MEFIPLIIVLITIAVIEIALRQKKPDTSELEQELATALNDIINLKYQATLETAQLSAFDVYFTGIEPIRVRSETVLEAISAAKQLTDANRPYHYALKVA
jgi:hypothetical protein